MLTCCFLYSSVLFYCSWCLNRLFYITEIPICLVATMPLNDMCTVHLVWTVAHIPTIQGQHIHWDGKCRLRSMTWNMILQCLARMCWMEEDYFNYIDVLVLILGVVLFCIMHVFLAHTWFEVTLRKKEPYLVSADSSQAHLFTQGSKYRIPGHRFGFTRLAKAPPQV